MPSAKSRTAVHLLAALQVRRNELQEEDNKSNKGLDRSELGRSDSLLFIKPKVLKHENALPPKDIEDVPFRRQDRRVLNARKKRVLLRKMIVGVLLMSLMLILIAVALLLYTWQRSEQNLDQLTKEPLAVVGFVLLISALAFIVVSFESCSKLRANKRRVRDPEIDRLKNLHHVKHWIAPELISYGWGHLEQSRSTREERKPLMLRVGGQEQQKIVGVYMHNGA